MSHLSFTFTALILLLLCSHGVSQAQQDKLVGGEYWLRHSLVLKGETKVFSNDVQFEWTDGQILNRGDRVRINLISDEGGFSRIKFSSGDKDYQLLVERTIKGLNRRAFDLIFASKPIKEYWSKYICEGKMKTRSDVLRCLGFPLDARKSVSDGKTIEELYYTCWYVGNCGGFDTYWIKIIDGKITDIAGTI